MDTIVKGVVQILIPLYCFQVNGEKYSSLWWLYKKKNPMPLYLSIILYM